VAAASRSTSIAAPGMKRSSERPASAPSPERLAQLGEQRGERRLGGRGRPLGPQEIDQLGSAAVAIAVEDEVGEQQPTLAAGQRRTDRPTTTLDPYRPAEPYDPAHRLTHYWQDATGTPRFLQGFANQRPASFAARRREALRRCGLRHGRCETHSGTGVARRFPRPLRRDRLTRDPRLWRRPALTPRAVPRGGRRLTPGHPPTPNVRRARREAGPSSSDPRSRALREAGSAAPRTACRLCTAQAYKLDTVITPSPPAAPNRAPRPRPPRGPRCPRIRPRSARTPPGRRRCPSGRGARPSSGRRRSLSPR
jgi:hypothetical protein